MTCVVSTPNVVGSPREDTARRLAFGIRPYWAFLDPDKEKHSALCYLKGSFDRGDLDHATEFTVPPMCVFNILMGRRFIVQFTIATHVQASSL